MIARGLVGVLVACLLLGCSTGTGSGPAPSPTPTPAPAYTVDQLLEAVPSVDQIEAAKDVVSTCPGDDRCGEAEGVTVVFGMAPSLTSEEVNERYDSYVLAEDLRIEAQPAADDAAATDHLTKDRREAEAFVGDFHTDGEFTDDRSSYTFGFDGTGTLDDATVAGWTGFVNRRDEVFTSPDGNDDSGPMAVTELHLRRGPTVIVAAARTLADETGRDRADQLARGLAEQYLARLERLG